jgi:hypothetical protein
LDLVTHGGYVGTKGAAAEIGEARDLSLARQSANVRQERGENRLAVRLPDCAKAQGGGDEIGGLGEDERL